MTSNGKGNGNNHHKPDNHGKAYDICGAKKKQNGGHCTRPAGWGTDHPGYGKCKLHGGCVPIKHGLYATTPRGTIGKHLATYRETKASDLANLTDELRLSLAVIQGLLDMIEDEARTDQEALTEKLGQWLERRARLTETHTKITKGEKLTIHIEQLDRLLDLVADLLREYVPEEHQADAINRLEGFTAH